MHLKCKDKPEVPPPSSYLLLLFPLLLGYCKEKTWTKAPNEERKNFVENLESRAICHTHFCPESINSCAFCNTMKNEFRVIFALEISPGSWQKQMNILSGGTYLHSRLYIHKWNTMKMKTQKQVSTQGSKAAWTITNWNNWQADLQGL